MNKLNKKKIKKIGILGGTFDPPHQGHLHISKIALKKFKLNRLIWVVTKKNPFNKKPYLSKNLRVKLSKEITKNEKKIFIKYLDEKIKSQSTFYLLKYLKNKNRKDKLFFLIGADNLIKFHTWKNWKEIPSLAKIVVFDRQNYTAKALRSIASKRLGKKELIFMTIAPLKGEQYYEILKDAIYPIERAISIMHKLIEEG